MRVRRAMALWTLLAPLAASAAEHHVSPGGTPAGTGAAGAPWDLATALAQPAAVKPGDTVWLHGGTYAGAFTSALAGSSGNPVQVRGAKGEWARLDGAGSAAATFTVEGQWAVFRDFEITNTDPSRSGVRAGGLDVRGANVKLVNLVVHDTGGNGFWSGAVDSEVYGCVVYHNGYDDTDRGHGHGLYTQNATGTKTIAENVIFGGYSFGIHAYTEGGDIQGFEIVGNVLFNAGVVSTVSGHKDDCLIGGLKPADRIALRQNLVWAIGGDTRAVQLGYSASNGSVELRDNYLIGALNFAKPWSSVTLSGNTLCTVTGVDTAQHPDNTYLTVDPSAPRVFVRPNAYEAGRANVVVYNWTRAATVDVDVSGVVAVGATYELRNAQNVLAAPVLTGTYAGGTLALPMTGLAPAQPIGAPGAYEPADQTGSIFNVFLLTSGEGTTPVPTPDAGTRADASGQAADARVAQDSGSAPGSDAAAPSPFDAGAEVPGPDAAGSSAADAGVIGTSPGCGCGSGQGGAATAGLLAALALALLRRRP